MTNNQSSIKPISEPPLNEEDVPPGEWLCPRCRALHDIRGIIDRKKKSNNQGYKRSKQTTNLEKTSSLKIATTKISVKDVKVESNVGIEAEVEPSSSSFDDSQHKIRLLNSLTAKKNPFAPLVRISLLLNPREFELPEDYIPNIQFPGTSKPKPNVNMASREARLTSYSVKRAQELDRNNLPLILRTCYFCRRGCRKAPLIHCDYCPLVYHADCIDPPLTILPNTRWMCPNHVEPIAEEKLLSSSSFCERVKLWNHFSKPIDHESIKISFLDKVHHSSSPKLETSEFVKFGCQVPKRVKREYERYMLNIEQYNGESDEQEEGCDQTEEQSSSKINVSLRQMIESSKLLESQVDSVQNSNTSTSTTSKSNNNGSSSNDLNRDVNSMKEKDDKDKQEWLEFIQKLSNPNSDHNHDSSGSNTNGKNNKLRSSYPTQFY